MKKFLAMLAVSAFALASVSASAFTPDHRSQTRGYQVTHSHVHTVKHHAKHRHFTRHGKRHFS